MSVPVRSRASAVAEIPGLVRAHPAVPLTYGRIVVPVTDRSDSAGALVVACSLAAERRAVITAVAVIEVPPLLPLDAHMSEEEDAARRLLNDARAAGESYGVTVHPRLVRAREAATAIVDEARAAGAELVVIGGGSRRRTSRHTKPFGKTLRNVLMNAPCRVMVISSP